MHRFLFFSLFVVASLFGLAKGVSMWFDSSSSSDAPSTMIAAAAPASGTETNGDETILRRDSARAAFS